MHPSHSLVRLLTQGALFLLESNILTSLSLGGKGKLNKEHLAVADDNVQCICGTAH